MVWERPAERSCDGVISGAPGFVDLFFWRVFMERVAESKMMINKKRWWGETENTWAVYIPSRQNRTWSISANVIAMVECRPPGWAKTLTLDVNKWKHLNVREVG